MILDAKRNEWLLALLIGAGASVLVSSPRALAEGDAPPPSAAAAKPAAEPSAKPASAAPKPAPKPEASKDPAAHGGTAKPPAKAAPAASDQPRTEEELARAAVDESSPSTESVMDHVLDDALAHPKDRNAELRAARQAAALAQQDLPLAPSRDDVVKVMSMLVPAIRGCAQGKSGLATVIMVVKNDGHVESAALNGAPFAGTASGGCMEGVVRRAKFPRFKQASFRVQFPFAVQ